MVQLLFGVFGLGRTDLLICPVNRSSLCRARVSDCNAIFTFNIKEDTDVSHAVDGYWMGLVMLNRIFQS